MLEESTTKQPERPKLLEIMGLGLITGASDDDPSGIAAYSQVGAQFGYGLAWTLVFSYPLMAAIQEISARIGRVTGCGIAGNLREYHPAWLLRGIVALLLLANVINIGADLGAMGAALKLLIGGPNFLSWSPLRRYRSGLRCSFATRATLRPPRSSALSSTSRRSIRSRLCSGVRSSMASSRSL
jgi:Mn2+/Fe2+ NRAMP family transporter